MVYQGKARWTTTGVEELAKTMAVKRYGFGVEHIARVTEAAADIARYEAIGDDQPAITAMVVVRASLRVALGKDGAPGTVGNGRWPTRSEVAENEKPGYDSGTGLYDGTGEIEPEYMPTIEERQEEGEQERLRHAKAMDDLASAALQAAKERANAALTAAMQTPDGAGVPAAMRDYEATLRG